LHLELNLTLNRIREWLDVIVRKEDIAKLFKQLAGKIEGARRDPNG
jgi:hypothetical protein